VALDERGTPVTTAALASKLAQWQLEAHDVAFVIGGPDGLDPAFKQAAHECLRLSDLTLPHAMVRVLLVAGCTVLGRCIPTILTTANKTLCHATVLFT
jgi:23S rRNA (pseudouridine1915-N3)-methyltransferase